MESDLEKYLQILNSERCIKKTKEATIILDKIWECFKGEHSQFTIGLFIGLVLDGNNAVFSFIWKNCSDVNCIPSIGAAFKLLNNLVTNFTTNTEPYFSVIFEKCLYLLDSQFARVKESSLKLIKTLLTVESKNVLDLSKLTTKFENYLREESKIQGTVLEMIYNLLGYLFEKFPESLVNKEQWFLNKMCETLRNELCITKNPSMSKVHGAFEGINGYFVNFNSPSSEHMTKIYKYMKIAGDSRDRKKVSLAALKILENHWRHFYKMMYDDRDFWKKSLNFWTQQNLKDGQSEICAFKAFYSVIAFVLKQNFQCDVFNNYLNEFMKALSLSGINKPYEKKSALTGIKLFVLTGVLEGDEFSRIHDLVMAFIRKQESYDSFTYLPLCIECVSAFVYQKYTTEENFYTEQLSCLQRLSVKVINQYPKFEVNFQTHVLTALEKSFYTLGLCGLEIMENHIDRVLYQGLIRTCSVMTLSELELLKETGQNEVESVSYKSYIGLWRYLLNLTSSPNRPVGGSFALKKGVATKVFDAFVDSLLRIVSKLNFNVSGVPDLETGVNLEKPSDLNIFINCVDLYLDLVPVTDHFNFSKWLIKIFQTFIHLSYKNPLLAGFYKLLTATLQIADRLQFFEDCTGENKKVKCFELVGKYLEDVLMKVDLYKGDLQVACLKTLLAAPVPLIEPFMEKTVPALEVIIHLGRGHFPLLKDVVETLERWDLNLPASTMNVIMEKILPHFDIFFQSPYFRGNNLVDSSTEGKKLKKKLVFSDSELLTLQKKFLIFLGHTGIQKAMNLIEFPKTDEEERIITDKVLTYEFPFGRKQTEIRLDEMLLRAMDLAVSCSDRRTRVTACEFLYSGVMIILSNVNQLSGGYTWIFRKVIKTCLILGCDSDSIVCQIFQPLMYQIVHYFAGKKTLNFSETQDLIDILMDSVTRPYDPAARDFSALLICEFTVWSIKQLTAEELKVTPESIRRILERIYSLSLHPSYNKRLGAAVVFNKIYSVLREEDFILETFWFQLYYYFMESLRMCDGPEDVTEIEDAIRHVKRPLVEKHEEFNKFCVHRVVPPEFEGGLLCHLVKWTLERCHDLRPATRKTAMTLVQELAPLVFDCDSLASFFKKFFPKDLFGLKEKSLENPNSINWLRYHCAVFEYCCWILHHKIVSPEDVFRVFGFAGMSKSYITGIIADTEKQSSGEDLKRQSVILYLNLLFALRERAFYFPTEIWSLLKVSIFKPSELGFDLNDVTTSENLFSVLTRLVEFLSKNSLDRKHFYENLETLIAAPVLSHITRNRNVSLNGFEFLFAFRVIESSGTWTSFKKQMLFTMDGGVVLGTIFRSLFTKQGKKVYTVGLEPSCKLYLDELLKLGLKLNCDLEDVLKLLENAEEVREEETDKTVMKGQFFQLQFRRSIFRFLESKHEAVVERVIRKGNVEGLKLLIQVLENMRPGDMEAKLPKEIFRRWLDFERLELINESPDQRRRILVHLAVCGAQVIGTPGFLKVSPISDKIFSILEGENLEEMNSGELEEILRLLPFLSNFGEGSDENVRLDVCLSKFKIDESFLTRSGSKKSTVSSIINGLLTSLKSTASLVLLGFIIRKVSWVEAVSRKEDVESALTVFGDIKTPLSHSVNALKLAYSFCFKYEDLSSFVSAAYSWFLDPLMRVLPKAAVQMVINDNLSEMADVITKTWNEDTTNWSDLSTDFKRRLCAAGMMQTFLTRLTTEELDELASEKKTVIDKIPGRCFPLLKLRPPGNALKECHRKFMCEVFNMISAIICARCTNPKFYKLFIFDERGSFLFAAVDNSSHIELGMDFDEIPKRKKQLTLLRKKITKERQMNLGQTLHSVKYVQTNTLFTSSLQEDVTQFDFTHSPVRPLDTVEGIGSKETFKRVEIELEMDALNSHECMTTVVGVVTKMVTENISPESGEGDTELPVWLKFFVGVLNNSKLSRNLKLFVLKAVYNVQDYVRAFCREVFPVVLTSITDLFADSPNNYFVIDLIQMIAGWKHLPKSPDHRRRLTDLVNSVSEKCDSFRWDIVKSNLEIIKTMVEVWKDCLYLSDLSSAAFKRFYKSVRKESKEKAPVSDIATYLNIQICGILLSNGIPPWVEGYEKQFFELVLENFREDNKKKEVFGEICGMALKHVEKENASALGDFENLVRDKISSQPISWLSLLYGVHKHYPKMSSMFTFKIFSSAWQSTDSLTVNKLEMLLSSVSREDGPEDEAFSRHAPVFLLDMLNSVDADVQEISLQIAEKLLDKFDGEKVSMLLKNVLMLQKSVHPGVRKWVYEIAMKSYKKNYSANVMKLCKNVLLKGLNDGVKSMEETWFGFWRSVLQFSSLYLVLLQILKEMYTPETENIFLIIMTKVLLESAKNGNNLEKPIFAHPITHQCKFQKRNLIFGLRSSALLSLSSSRTWTNQSLEVTASLGNQNLPYLRPTPNSLKFQPTLMENSEANGSANVDSSEDLPKNPFKVRFYKSSAKTTFSFLKRQKEKKKRESEEEEEIMKKKETEVDIFGEYSMGDYPDIQISHSQILKPLEALAKADHQIARQFLVAFYSGLIKTVKPEEKSALLSETSKCFENILKSSTSFDPGVFGFVLQVSLEHLQTTDIDCELISNAAVSSNWLSLGALIIEQNISCHEGSFEKEPKRRRGSQSPEAKMWLELAKLYRCLEEFDVLSGIFLDKLNVEENARAALHSESLLNWLDASKHYETVLQTDCDSLQSEFYKESYFSCLAKLSNWSLLNKCIRTTVDENLDELWRNYNLLSWFLRSEMMISLGSDQSEFINVLKEFSKNESQLNVLSTNFGEELAVFDWLSNKLTRANYRIDRLCLDFLAGWSHLNRWSYNLRAAKLASLQTLSELSFAVRTLSESSKSHMEENLTTGRKRWEKNVPSARDDLTIWDVKLGYRREFMKQLRDFDLERPAIESDLALTKAALGQNNLILAKECLVRIKGMLSGENSDLRADYDYCFNQSCILVANTAPMYLKVWKEISDKLSSVMDTDSSVSQIHVYRCNFTLGQLVSAMLPLVDEKVSSDTLKSLSLRLKTAEDLDSVTKALKNKGLEYFEAAKDTLDSISGSFLEKSTTYLELAKFILKFSDRTSFLDFEKFTKFLLKSMRLGNRKAKQLFGCALNMSHLIMNESSLKGLITESESVPSWMFLMWINQMLASLNSKMFPLLKSIILRIAQDYPNSIRYAFKVLKESSESRDPKTKTFFIRLGGLLLNDQLYENFMNAANYLAPPDLILRYHLENALQEVTQESPNYEKAKSILAKLHKLMFSPDFEKFRGSVFTIWEKFKEPLEKVLTLEEDKEALQKHLKDVLLSLETVKLPSKRVLSDLESYSPWLYSFHALRFATALEVPGQYDGDRKPIKENLLTVSSFKSDVVVFESKCRPMRISVLANDAAEHKFLIKFGEDLRQDQRIQQVFEHFNYKLKESKHTGRFYLETYKVIPLTVSLGMIEWIEHNVSLYKMIENSLGNDADLMAKAQSQHLAFLSQDSLPGNPVAAHLSGYEKVKREAAISNFNVRVHQFSRDLLKKAFLGLSTSPEHFVHLRGNFATSHAVTCVTHWLVGIGDRHLQNILVSTKTGRVLGIDFGHAFGSATQVLVPPELIPFRLTSQILSLMDPLNESGWIKQTMVHGLRLFRKESFGLLSMLEVFAQEPVMDWLKQAKKSERGKRGDSDSWYPRQKLSMVEKKLNGANPVAIFEADLVAGHSKSKYLKKYLEVLRGVPQDNIRTRCAEGGLTVEEQVECLIDLATDPHVLSKTYVGWNPWL